MPSESFNIPKDVKKVEEILLVKKQVLQQLIERFKERLGALTSSRDSTREMAKDAPNANQSHSDTSKFQLSGVQLGLDSVRVEIEQTILMLKPMPLDSCNKVILGAIFTICEIGGNEKNYFLVSAGGGETLDLNGKNIVSIAPKAPIARACLQKEVGDVFEFQGKEFEITRII